MVSDKPPCPQNAPAVVAKHVQVAFLRHRKRAIISTGSQHDLSSGNAKLQPEAARESCGEVCEDYSMPNHNLMWCKRHHKSTDGSAARSLYIGIYPLKHSLGCAAPRRAALISLLFETARIYQKQLMQTIAKINNK